MAEEDARIKEKYKKGEISNTKKSVEESK